MVGKLSKKIAAFITASLLALLMTGCVDWLVAGLLEAGGDIISVKAEADAEYDSYAVTIKSLAFISGKDVTLEVRPSNGPAQVEVQCAQDLVSRYGLVIEISGDEITIHSDVLKPMRTDKLNITIHGTCRSIDIDGGYEVDIDASGVQNFSLNANGALQGKVYGLNTEQTKCSIDGAADIQFEGASRLFSGVINGAGQLDSKELDAQDVTLVINGAGAATLASPLALDATINGAGSIGYHGDPQPLKRQVNGAGSIERLD
ncbi:MAG: GIN domain-containing protein [Christensenellales bacterium]